MRIWVTGSSGMLGKHVCEAVKERGHHLFATTHWECPIEDLGIVHRVARDKDLDVIINCAGCRQQADPFDMIRGNVLGPYVLASTKVRLVHMSTNCVFSGHAMARARSSDLPDPDGLYARTKLAGEVDAPHVLNVRGSFIGPNHGFLHWLMNATGEIEAWDNAWWNGTTVDIMAETLADLAEGDRVGVVHAAAESAMSKGLLAQMFVDALNLPLQVIHIDEPKVFAAIEPDIILQDTEQVMAAYVEELKCLQPA